MTTARVPYARKGEQITCENGHVIAEFIKTVYLGERCNPERELGHWRDPEPATGTPLDEIRCCRCGAYWVAQDVTGAEVYHIGDIWRCGDGSAGVRDPEVKE